MALYGESAFLDLRASEACFIVRAEGPIAAAVVLCGVRRYPALPGLPIRPYNCRTPASRSLPRRRRHKGVESPAASGARTTWCTSTRRRAPRHATSSTFRSPSSASRLASSSGACSAAAHSHGARCMWCIYEHGALVGASVRLHLRCGAEVTPVPSSARVAWWQQHHAAGCEEEQEEGQGDGEGRQPPRHPPALP